MTMEKIDNIAYHFHWYDQVSAEGYSVVFTSEGKLIKAQTVGSERYYTSQFEDGWSVANFFSGRTFRDAEIVVSQNLVISQDGIPFHFLIPEAIIKDSKLK